MFTVITPPNVGDPTRNQSFAVAVVDDLNFLYNLLLSTIGSREIITNGSFESDVDVDGIPDNWTRTLYTGGSFSHETSTVAADGKALHGKRSVKFTSPGGASNGGGYITTTDFFEVSEKRFYQIAFSHKSSAAGIHNLVEITWYDSTQTLISTTTLYDSTSNPTSWTLTVVACETPANARYAKITLTGAKDDNTTAGSAWFDDVRIATMNLETQVILATAGSYSWTCPAGVYFIEALVIGGGGGGGGGAGGGSNSGGGGGAGGMAKVVTAVTPGTTYAVVIGAAGTAGSSAGPTSGGAGGNSTLTIGATTYTGAGGALGVNGAGSGNGGAGGSATNGDVNTTGGNGANRSGASGGDGGKNTLFGAYPAGGTGAGGSGPHYGAGGAGGGSAGANGGAGAAGAIILRW